MKWTANEIALIGTATTVVVAILSALIAYMVAKRERRRTLYSEAIQAIVAWKEMLYRVRRRSGNQVYDLVAAFHDLQDKLSYYEAWIGSESKYMSRSYKRLVKAVKSKTDFLIRDAWKESIRDPAEYSLPSDDHPDLAPNVEAFLNDVRSHLSPYFWRRIALAYRNREVK
ncbi:hypothetical protein [Acidithrix ferrooxidans]|uniref:DUF4760 domain-containing protein n=1 Tax=Acidithrix ferrooxidans TaxID=1280514 RepID=A0A0D8HJX5_9ACTN|nr:hypothetical protein [Acidithrix ferrooxidans]KJF18047.1 hypothetical protein AXFE_11460 [Acidithrix ferrooxidans]